MWDKYYLKTCNEILCNNKAWKEPEDDPEKKEVDQTGFADFNRPNFLLLLISSVKLLTLF
jgi:hypothetical protein